MDDYQKDCFRRMTKSLETIRKEIKQLAWDEQKRVRMEAKINRVLGKLARDIDAIGIIAIAFIKDGDYTHQIEGGWGMVPGSPAEIYRRTANSHDRLAEFGEHFDPEDKGHVFPISRKS
jgi:hypothetical protein